MKEKILKILSAGDEYISGEKLSNLCGVSRTAIWKHINNLKEEGYEINSQSRIGYKLIKRPDSLLKTEILQDLKTKKWAKELLYTFEEVNSTNKVAKKLANEGKAEGTVVVAEHQSQGKGRLGRTWSSPKGKGIWVSIILRPHILPTKASQITFVIAVGMLKALKNFVNLDVKIKWPNDILINTKKVAGILTELSAEIERINYVVIGIGVNVNQSQNEFPLEFRDKATSLKLASGQEIARVKVLQAMLEEIEKAYNLYLAEGFSPIIDQWKQNSFTLGKEVKVLMNDGEIEGLAFDVNEDGCLLVKDDDKKVHTILAGDVSVRLVNGDYA